MYALLQGHGSGGKRLSVIFHTLGARDPIIRDTEDEGLAVKDEGGLRGEVEANAIDRGGSVLQNDRHRFMRPEDNLADL
jgi:hypothetical protein